MKSPRLSIIVPNYNYARFLPRLATCLDNQTLGLDIVELIFVDDGSDDDSLDKAVTLEALPLNGYDQVALEHCGAPGLVRNAGLERSHGEFLLCLDPDDLPGPDFLACCIAQLDDFPEAGLAYTDYTHVEPASYREVILPDFDPDLLKQQNILPPAAVMRRAVWEQSSGYRDNTAYEDWDFWVQLAAKGVRGARISQVLYAHMVHGQNFSFSAQQQDGRAKAAIVLNNPDFFPASVRHWATALMAGEPWAIPFPRGIIPNHKDISVLLEQTADLSATLSTRRSN